MQPAQKLEEPIGDGPEASSIFIWPRLLAVSVFLAHVKMLVIKKNEKGKHPVRTASRNGGVEKN